MCVCVYIYVYIYVCVYILCICVYIDVYIYIYIYVYICRGTNCQIITIKVTMFLNFYIKSQRTQKTRLTMATKCDSINHSRMHYMGIQIFIFFRTMTLSFVKARRTPEQ